MGFVRLTAQLIGRKCNETESRHVQRTKCELGRYRCKYTGNRKPSEEHELKEIILWSDGTYNQDYFA